jgi:hypothetical protein
MTDLKNWKWLTPAEISYATGVALEDVCEALPHLLREGKAEHATLRCAGVELPVFRSSECLWA